MNFTSSTLRLPVSTKASIPEAARALEQAWQRRRQELAGWQPKSGWLSDPQPVKRGDSETR